MLHDVEVHQADPSHAGRSEVHAQRGPQASHSDDQGAGAPQPLLTLQADLRKDEVSTVPLDLLLCQVVLDRGGAAHH